MKHKPDKNNAQKLRNIQNPTLEDLPQILKLFSSQDAHHYAADPIYYVEPDDPERIEKLTKDVAEAISDENSSKKIAVIRVNGELVGVVTYEIGENAYHDTRITKFIEIKELFVIKTNRGQGVATDLVKKVKSYANDHKIHWMRADYSPFNKEAFAFWTKMRFIPRQVSSFFLIASNS